ncbi:S53 family peptidase [Neobacillus cucumis]|uniref:S53 family peptidase n=1 Tax=Neobacillus cucumis TaxID=1740721 RepID=UPI002853709B|nr:S53 family peptidase [Neobacillus cucumis]MDR4947143.1 S53 family peptidase [Neobacillus cucumis]
MGNEKKPLNSQGYSSYKKLSGSERKLLPDASKLVPVHSNEKISVTVLIRRPPVTSFLEKASTTPVTSVKHLSREEFVAVYGTDQKDLLKVKEFADQHGLSIREINTCAGTIELTGPASAFCEAFKVELSIYEHPTSPYRGRTGEIQIPEDLSDIVEAVLGLDNRTQLRPHYRILEEKVKPHRSQIASKSYTPTEVAQLYHFPQNTNCSNQQCIGIIELGGGYSPSEIKQYFSSLGVTPPVLTDVSVNGARNQPTGDPGGPDGEVALDIEVAGAVFPGVKIAVYFAPNTDAGFLNAINTAIHDTVNRPSVISISWGAPESEWTLQAMKAMDRAFQDAAALGVTICCASGDRGSADGVNDGLVHVDFPASSPHVLGCGGTKLSGSGQTITREVVWNEGPDSSTGGGVSDVFSLPAWQSSANVPPSANPGSKKGRGVPDVAGDADPVTGYQVLVDGQKAVFGGTSAVAPLWAGLIAILNQQLGHPVGFLNPALYQLSASSKAFRDITSGNNESSTERGAYTAKKGWDPCTGLGSPNGTNLINALKN